MVESRQHPGRIVRFGPFEVDLEERVLRKSGIRIKLQAQPFEVLAALIEKPGVLVTREELQRRLWPQDTFVDFEHGLNAAITRLRQALGESVDHPRYIETFAKRGYRFNGTVEIPVVASFASEAQAMEKAAAEVTDTRPLVRPDRLRWYSAAAVILGAGSLLAAFAIVRIWRQAPESVFSQLTSDPGLTTDPTISPDGKLVAYASDRGGGPLHIWVQQVAGSRSPIQRTNGHADDHQPDFSPDGTRIAFRSERDGGGIYVVSTLAGEARLIAKSGRDPKFSPDGKRIAYWVGTEWGSMLGVATGKVFVVSSSGGEPKQVAADFAIAGLPVWSPDGSHLLFCGQEKLTPQYSGDWWVVGVDGKEPVRTGALKQFASQGISLGKLNVLPYPRGWRGSHILFSARSGDSVDIWRVPITARTGLISGPAEPVTRGAGFAASPSASNDGQIVFARISHQAHLWKLPVNANRGQATGEPRQLTESGGSEFYPTIASTGTLAFTSVLAGKSRLALKDLQTGKESLLPESESEPQFATISPDGNKIAYSVVQTGGAAVQTQGAATGYLMSLDRLVPEQIQPECDLAWGWTPDGRHVICASGPRVHGHLVDVATRSVAELMSDPDNSPVYQPRVSPDGLWLMFGTLGGVWVAPFRRQPVAKSEWSPLLVTEYFDDHPQWSPDGNLVYFTSARDGSRCVWAQRLDASSKKPLSDAWPVHHFHSARRSIVNVGSARVNLVVRRTDLIVPLGELRGNVWMMQPSR